MLRASRTTVLSLSALFLVCTAGCSGTTATTEGDASPGTDASSGGDAPSNPDSSSAPDSSSSPDTGAATDAWTSRDGATGNDAALSGACPGSPPANGSACSMAGLECEYGTDYDPSCNVLAKCQAGKWSVTPPRTGCPSADAGIGPGCPATFAGVPQGQACTPGGLRCDYPEGTCSCFMDHTGVPLLWGCFPATGCPYPRPRLGSACAPDGQQCEYASCGNGMACTAGVWQSAPLGCHP